MKLYKLNLYTSTILSVDRSYSLDDIDLELPLGRKTPP
jgi:hypothetical protein